MPLPDLIEIVPLTQPVNAEITVPGSKSITNRALILAALADGETILQGALWSEDTQVMADCLQKLGFKVTITPDSTESSNRTITVQGLNGKIPSAGTESKPLELFVGNAGTAARFLAAMVCLGKGVYRLSGVPRMHERPQAALFQALRQLGYRIDSANDKLPATIYGTGVGFEKCQVSIEESSQFASALLLPAKIAGWQVEIIGENPDEAPYVVMTSKLVKAFPWSGGTFQIEPDASSASYFHAADRLAPWSSFLEYSAQWGRPVPTMLMSSVKISKAPLVTAYLPKTTNSPAITSLLDRSGWQVDEKFREVFLQMPRLCFNSEIEEDAKERKELTELAYVDHRGNGISRKHGLGDSIMTAIVLAPLVNGPMRFIDLDRLRVQECERVEALRTELTKCGAKVIETGDTLEVFPSKLHGAEIETYNDHRMAMCFAILGLKVPGIKIKNPACVKKTFPNFFQKLAAAPPAGLGAIIRDAKTNRELPLDELFAE